MQPAENIVNLRKKLVMSFLHPEVSENLSSSLPFSPEHSEYRGVLKVSAKDMFINNTDLLALWRKLQAFS